MSKRFNEKIAPFITKENAEAWDATEEKWIFVTGLINDADIGYDPWGDNVDRMVRYIEIRFEKMLKDS